MRIAIQGEEASFHALAARQFFGNDVELVSCATFTDTFAALANGRADQAVVAIENSLFGSINEVYDLLLKHSFSIVGEVYLRVEQCLIGLPGSAIEDVREVHSHPVALAQCEAYLDETLTRAERFEHHDTAGSVADVKKWGDKTKTAIASEAAAKLHDMVVLAKGVETHKQNYTRFVVLSLQPTSQPTATNKTSLVLTTDHAPGALYKALGVFASRNINLTKLQSRPIVGSAWHYMFYVDVSAGSSSEEFQQALVELKTQQCDVTLLGSYQENSKL